MKVKVPIRIEYRKLRRSLAVGLAWKEDRLVQVDDRLKGFDLLGTLIHEIVHVQNPKWPEIKVEGHAAELTKLLWEQGFRKADL